jgi:hypothetical protein
MLPLHRKIFLMTTMMHGINYYRQAMKHTVILCLASFLLTVSCKPPTVLFYSTGGMVQEDCSGGGEEVQHAILRYQKGDTLQYLFDNLSYLNDYPREIRSPYVCYTPKEQSGVLGVHVGRCGIPPLGGESVLPVSEMQDYRDMESRNVYYLPLYRYQICDSIIRFHKMTQDERTADTTQIYSTLYTKGKWLLLHSYHVSRFEIEFMPEVKMIFSQLYNVNCKYLIRSDTVFQYIFDLYSEDYVTNIPMFHLPLETDVYYKKNRRNYLVRKRLGFRQGEPFVNDLSDYSHEIDTALLALPVRIFQGKYMQTKDIYSLDGVCTLIR